MKEPTRRERERIEREEAILSKAEELFCRHGYEKISMDDLAKKSEYTKRTIYRYFPSKEDLFFAVALRGYKRLFEMMKNQSKPGKTGLEKIRLSYLAYYEFFCKHPEMLQMINMTGVVKSSSAGLELPHRQNYTSFDKVVFEELVRIFIEGKTDGSIRVDVDISQLALSSIFVANGFFHLLSLSGDTFTRHFNLDRDAFVKTTIEILVDTLRSK